jgi:two-component system response regulator (stage 0 sporulation protein F)
MNRFRQRKILLVEDMAEVRGVLMAIMAANHCAVTEAINGEDAIAFFDRDKPDVVILDIRLPRVDGFEVFAHIRAIDQSIPVIVTTGLLDAYVIEVIYGYGWAIFARKPQDINTGFFGAVLGAFFTPFAPPTPN